MTESAQFLYTTLKNEQKMQIVYFSGTGGSSRVALNFEKIFSEKGIQVVKVPLDMQEAGYQETPAIENSVGLLIIIFPVHAFDAPIPVYEWIEGVENRKGLPCAVISVSGGGEVWPNTCCRAGCIEFLERKGYNVFYERMLVMPSNIFIATNEQLTVQLLKIMPLKVEHSIDEILAGVRRRRKKPLTAKMLALISKMEKRKAQEFGRDLKTHENCTGCGWCTCKCPRKNIKMMDERPLFGDRCIVCLRCVYGCPVRAIYTQHYSPLLVKNGFNINQIEKRMNKIEILPLDNIKTGILYIGVKKYLKEISF
jgi:ferredoxin/flavodoxin